MNGKRNFRWDFIRSGYLVRLERAGKPDWFLLNAPKRVHKSMTVSATVTCEHVCSLLNKKNLYLTFDDTNGIGTAQYLLEQVLSGTGWQMGFCETFYENDGVTEKVRSISCDTRRGAYLLISDICKLFAAYPVYDGETRTVNIYSLNRHEDMLELNFAKNLTGVERKEDAADIVTRLYVEGEYADGGYVGIDDVNPSGLPFLFNFDYFRELGVFTEAHEQALQEYLRDIAAAKADSTSTAAEMIALDGRLNELWGSPDYILYTMADGEVAGHILGGDATEEQAELAIGDELTVLLADGTHITLYDLTFPDNADYVIKWITKASGLIGGKEVAIEAKRQSIESWNSQLVKETDQAKQETIREQIALLEKGIQEIYEGTAESVGLYALMREAVDKAIERDKLNRLYDSSMNGQEEIEQRFAKAMGDLLRDGYWSNTSYAPGQEELLFLEGQEIMAKLAKPSVTYTVTVQNLSGISGYEQEVFQSNMAVRLWDEALSLNDQAYVTK